MELEIDCHQKPVADRKADTKSLKEIPRISSLDLTYQQFFSEFMLKNLPVIITDLQVTTELSATFCTGDDVNYDILEETFKDHEVPVAGIASNNYETQKRNRMKFKDYLNYMRNYQSGSMLDVLYLKDFHIKNEFPDINVFNVPHFFGSDWLNEYEIDKKQDDYRFMYMGPEGSCTYLHADVLMSYSWSSNLFGLKKWVLLPPGEEDKLKDSNGRLRNSISPTELDEIGVDYFNVIQEANEALFVPSQWYHQVWNLKNTASVNHNWINGTNIRLISEKLQSDLRDVEKEISDVRDMENYDDHCQLMLKCVSGINFTDILNILKHIADKRIDKLINGTDFKVFDRFTFGKNHLLFDLKAIENVLLNLSENEAIQKLPVLMLQIAIIQQSIRQVL